ncbi:MAG: TetR/AcrR family transcriptional regulator C-terminal domain-containing protein [Proteobacteria bacterium]|nr:TetR/AcrR family transcriptional regulator C-terminal domain-containing protein [Pseudomonadota bacterium]
MKTRHSRGQRGLLEADLVEAALAEIERGGLEGFSLRCAARAIGCDVATLSYRFGSKQGLERAIADRLQGSIEAPARDLDWQTRFVETAKAYRRLARRYPNAFPLLLRFWTSGPQDLQLAEEWYQTLFDAGLTEANIPAVSFATYAAILGVCAGEIGGLIDKPSREMLDEIEEQSGLPLIKKLLPHFHRLKDDDVFEAAVINIVAGIKAQVASQS